MTATRPYIEGMVVALREAGDQERPDEQGEERDLHQL